MGQLGHAGDAVAGKPFAFGSRACVTDRDAGVYRGSDRTLYGLGPSNVIMGWVNADDFAMIDEATAQLMWLPPSLS